MARAVTHELPAAVKSVQGEEWLRF
jgi:hypothetical protein